MANKSKAITVMILMGFLLQPSIAVANEPNQRSLSAQTGLTPVRQTENVEPGQSIVRVLSDHPGSATALTQRQKSEIKAILKMRSNLSVFICTGVSLPNQRESMYPVVLLRAQLVCDYAKALAPTLETVVREKRTLARQFNGRVVVVSK